MSKSKLVVLLGASAAFLALCAALVVSGYGGAKAKGLWLEQRSTGDIQGIEIIDHGNGRKLELSLEDGKWVLNHEVTAIDEKTAPLLAALAYFKAAYKVETPGSLDQYGLAPPKATVRVSFGPDRRVWELGGSQDGHGLYVKNAEGDAVYLIDDLRSEVIGLAVENFLEIPLNRVNLHRIIGFRISSPAQGEIRLNRSESPHSGGDFFWRMFEPYGSNAKKNEVEAIVATLADEPWARRAEDDSIAAAAMDKADKEITFYDSFDRQLVLRVGIPDGNRVFCEIEGLSGAYTVTGALLSVFETDPASLVDMELYHFEPASVSEFFFALGTREHRFISVWENTGEAGRQGQRFILDGQAIPGADYHEFAGSVAGVRGEELYFREKSRLGEPLGRMNIRRISPPYEQEILFCRIRGEPDLAGVDFGGRTVMYTKRADLEKLMDEAEALLR
ncbi:hypothetical protein AGMMS49587_19640 [Spirochaetia bacterium]|nr:hypothetical protein AGMMS49587_19640 [Spirochaetia bacterium]